MYWKIPLAFDQVRYQLEQYKKSMSSYLQSDRKNTPMEQKIKNLIPVKQPPTNIQEWDQLLQKLKLYKCHMPWPFVVWLADNIYIHDVVPQSTDGQNWRRKNNEQTSNRPSEIRG